MINVSTVFEEDGVLSAGGYLVQLLPGASRGPLLVMTERLEDFRNIDSLLRSPDYSPAVLNEELLYAMPFTRLGESDVRFECWCSYLGVISALTTLPRKDVQDMIDEGEVLEISCDYCNAQYRVAPVELRGLLEQS
jgi:molecular chaperone Hsp33